jgi:hypothetical protein
MVRLVGLPEEPDIIGVEREARAGRWTALAGSRRLMAAGLVALVVGAAIVIAVIPRHQPAAAEVTQPGATGVFNSFADGTADGQGWQLTVQNVASDGHSCLPAVVLSGEYGDPLFPHPDLGLTAAGSPAVIAGASGTSFAFFRVPSAVRQLRVAIGAALPLSLTPATDSECGRAFRLAGFAFATAARVTVTAVTGHGPSAPYHLPSALVHPAAGAPDRGGWQNLDRSAGWGTPHLIDQARVNGTLWGITVAIGAYGECFSLTRNAGRELSSPRCTPVIPTGEDVPLGTGNALEVFSDVALVSAMLPGGTTTRASPVDIGGRLYVGLITAVSPLGIVCYDASGAIISGINWTTEGPR